MSGDVRKNEWRDFIRDISTRCKSWTAKVEVISADLGDQILADGLPLSGITIEANGNEAMISITLERGNRQHTHTIQNPERLALFRRAGRNEEVLDIEESGGTKTLITLAVSAASTESGSGNTSVAHTRLSYSEFPSFNSSPRELL